MASRVQRATLQGVEHPRQDLPGQQRLDRPPPALAPPNLLLRSIGAKTGAARTNSLTYAKDGETYLIVASNAAQKVIRPGTTI